MPTVLQALSVLLVPSAPTVQSAAVDWWTANHVTTQTGEVLAAAVRDALKICHPAVRLHDGTRLIAVEDTT